MPIRTFWRYSILIKELKNNVLLLHAPINKYQFGKKWKESKNISPPLGLLYLGTPLQREGYKVTFVDLNVDFFVLDKFLDFVKKFDFILITCLTATIYNVKELIEKIKMVHKSGVIICGGPFCNTIKEYIEGSDLTCIGEAEGYITQILDSYILGKSFTDIPGLMYKENGKLVKTDGIMKVDDLDTSLLPARELANRKKYGFIGKARFDVALIMSSRGCPFNCRYCSFILNNKIYRERSVENVINEIKRLVMQRYKYIIFGDDNFLVNKRRVHKIMDRIIQENIKVRLIVQGRVDSADYKLYSKLRKAGVFLILFGIESANQDVLDYYNKKTTVEKSIEAVKIANKVGIITFGSFLLGAPLETKKHFERNKKFFDMVPLDLMNCNQLIYVRGSELWEDAFNKGLILENDNHIMTNRKLSNFSSEELTEIRRDLTYYFYKNPRRWLRLYSKLIRNGDFKAIVKITTNVKTAISNFLGRSTW